MNLMSLFMVFIFLLPIVSIVWFAFHIAHHSAQHDAMGPGERKRLTNTLNGGFFGGGGDGGGGGCSADGGGGGGGCS
jgi:hypothetical protein